MEIYIQNLELTRRISAQEKFLHNHCLCIWFFIIIDVLVLCYLVKRHEKFCLEKKINYVNN